MAQTQNDGIVAVDTAPQTGRRRWIGLGVLAAALSMIVLDGTIVGVALPVLIDKLKLDLSEAQWVNGIYSVVFAALLLTAGRLGDRLGRRRMLVVGILIFMAGSLLAALSGDAGALILARVVQGVGGALILPTTLSSVNATFRGRDRAVAFGIWGAVISGMAAFGPLLGGWLTTAFGWQWIFVVNLPLGAIILVGAFLTVTDTRAVITSRGLDVDGLLLSAIGFGGLVFAMIEGRALGWWKPTAEFSIFGWVWPASAPVSPVPVAGAIGVAAIALFILWERHRGHNGRSAILDLSLFTVPTFTWGNLTALCVAIGEFGLLFVLPLFIVNAMGLTTLGAVLVLAAMGVGAFFSGSMARHLAERMGAPNVVLLGLGIEVVGVTAAALLLSASGSPWLLALLLVVYGLGLGLASAQLTGTVLADIPTEQSGQGSATQSTVRQVGSALGTALIGGVLAAGLSGTGPEALSAGMADASRTSLFVAAGFLALGFLFALRLRSRSRRRP